MDNTDLILTPTLNTDILDASNVYHYADDEFVRFAIQIKSEIGKRLVALNESQRRVTRLRSKGMSIVKIAAEVGRTTNSVSATIKRQDVLAILELMQHYDLVIEGPQEFQRKNMLWRIASKNEDKSPKVAVDAVDKLNKMDNSYGGSETHSMAPIQIVINNSHLPKGALDQ